jgi:hypothetical protein
MAAKQLQATIMTALEKGKYSAVTSLNMRASFLTS